MGKVEATILIGLSTVGGAFSEPIVREMARKVYRPIIFPLSNPTDKSEAKADDLIRWTDGRSLVATGSPFAPVRYAGKTIPIAQCNNVFIFPAIGLGVVASGASDAMMLAAARVTGVVLVGFVIAHMLGNRGVLRRPSEEETRPPLPLHHPPRHRQ